MSDHEKKYVIAYTKEFGEVSVVFHYGYVGAGIDVMSSVRGELWNHYHALSVIPCTVPTPINFDPAYLVWPGLTEEQRNQAADMLYYMGWTLNYLRQSMSSLGDLVRLGVVNEAEREKLHKRSVELLDIFYQKFGKLLGLSDPKLGLKVVNRSLADDILAKQQKLDCLREEVSNLEKELGGYECTTKTDN